MTSEKGKRWLDRNSFDKKYDYTLLVLRKFNIKKYHFTNDEFGNSALIITDGLNKYKLEIVQENYFDKDFDRFETESYMKISKTKTHRTGQKHSKDYWCFKKKFKEDCIYKCIEWISKGSMLNNTTPIRNLSI